MINNFINLITMNQVGSMNRRKSYATIQPCLPRKINTRGQGTRTVYQQMPSPSQELKTFRRRLVFDSLPSVDSLPQINKKTIQKNHQNLSSNYFSETTSGKNNNTLMTMGSQTDMKTQKNLNQTRLLNKNATQLQQGNSNQLKNQDVNNQQYQTQIKLNIDEDIQKNQNIQDDIQGYTMGNQVQQQEQYDDKHERFNKLKSYAKSQSHIIPYSSSTYEIINEAQARMQQRYIKSHYQIVRNRKQDAQFMQLLNKFKVSKQQILKNSKRKTETMRALVAMRRANSLPKISNTIIKQNNAKQIIVPSYEQLQNPDGNPQQRNRRILTKRLQPSMSFGKLQIYNSSKKNKDIDHEKYFEEQLNQALNMERILREKGVTINSTVLKNSLINIRQVPKQICGEIPFVSARLMSNPFHPKQVPKKKKNK